MPQPNPARATGQGGDVVVNGKRFTAEEYAQLQALDAFLRGEEEAWAQELKSDRAGAEGKIKALGGTDLLGTIGMGVLHGASHGLSDDAERAGVRIGQTKTEKDLETITGRRAANAHIKARASNPAAFGVSQAAGALGSSLLLRVGVPRAAAGAARNIREGARGAAGFVRPAAESRARAIESAIGNYGIKSPRARALALDAGHGAAFGYGGLDVVEDEEAFSGERLARTAGGAAMSALAAPMAVSAGAAATNIPLLWGGRRMGSKRMLEPQGVSRDLPEGRPRDAILIARAKDESAARAAAPRETSPDAIGLVNRDTARPMDSTMPNTRRLADQALEPVARDRIADLRRREMDDAASALEAAYPVPAGRGGEAAITRRSQAPDSPYGPGPHLTNGEKKVLELEGQGVSIGEIARQTGSTAKVVESQIARARRKIADAGGAGGPKPAIQRALDMAREIGAKGKSEKARFLEETFGATGGKVQRTRPADTPGAEDLARARRARGERPDPLADMREAQLLREAARREAREADADAAATSGAGAPPRQGELDLPPRQNPNDRMVDEMMEAVVRQDAPALASWMSTLRGAAREDAQLMDLVRARVARILATNERANPGLNDTPAMAQFLNALGMAGNKAKGTQNMLEAARGPARERYNPQRYEAALQRLGEGGERMRPRHAARMRQEMETFEPGAYTGPWDPRMGSALVARGDDRPYWVDPRDFFSRRKHVGDDAVQMAGVASAPLAMASEGLVVGPAASAMFGGHASEREPLEARRVGPGEYDARPQQTSQPDVRQNAQPATQRAVPRQSGAPVLAPRIGPAAGADAADPGEAGSKRQIRELQTLLMEAQFDVGPEMDDGIYGSDTRAAVAEIAKALGMTGEPKPAAVLNMLRHYKRQLDGAPLTREALRLPPA